MLLSNSKEYLGDISYYTYYHIIYTGALENDIYQYMKMVNNYDFYEQNTTCVLSRFIQYSTIYKRNTLQTQYSYWNT